MIRHIEEMSDLLLVDVMNHFACLGDQLQPSCIGLGLPSAPSDPAQRRITRCWPRYDGPVMALAPHDCRLLTVFQHIHGRPLGAVLQDSLGERNVSGINKHEFHQHMLGPGAL